MIKIGSEGEEDRRTFGERCSLGGRVGDGNGGGGPVDLSVTETGGLIVSQITFAWGVRAACRELSFLAVDLSPFLESAPTHIHKHIYIYIYISSVYVKVSIIETSRHLLLLLKKSRSIQFS